MNKYIYHGGKSAEEGLATVEYRRYTCLHCQHKWLEDCDASDYPNYCPHCGAKMEGGEKDAEVQA